MYKGKTILGLITARGGSKGLPGKNIRPMLGKPLIGWTVEQALRCNYLDRVVVSTDDREIADTARRFGAEVPFMRPEDLATDQARSVDVIFHALDFYEEQGVKFDYVALLQPTSPLRAENDLAYSIETLIEKEMYADSLVSVGEVSHGHPVITQQINENGQLKPFLQNFAEIKTLSVRRQDMPVAYLPYGVIFLSKTEALRKHETFYQERTLPYIIPRWQHYEIDDIYDFITAETVWKARMEGQDELIR